MNNRTNENMADYYTAAAAIVEAIADLADAHRKLSLLPHGAGFTLADTRLAAAAQHIQRARLIARDGGR